MAEEVVHLIPLTRGRHAIVDEQDWEEMRKYAWRATWDPDMRTFYATRSASRKDGKRRTVQMSRQILGLEHGDRRQVDHWNHYTLDNRRGNIRACSPRENQSNRRDQSRHGVGVGHRHGSFLADVFLHGKRHFLGTFTTAEEAQAARATFLECPESYERPLPRNTSVHGLGVDKLPSGRFRAYVRKNHIGVFDTAEEARDARKRFLRSPDVYPLPRQRASPHGPGIEEERAGRFRARARVDGKKIHLGTFATAEEAREARRRFLEERT